MQIDSLHKLNTLLKRIKVPISVTTLEDCVATLWVALFEGLFECRIPGIDRSFDIVSSESSRLRNTELVLNELGSNVIQMDISHIKPKDLVDRKKVAVTNMIDIFHEIAQAIDTVKLAEENVPKNAPKNVKQAKDRQVYKGKEPISNVMNDLEDYLSKMNAQQNSQDTHSDIHRLGTMHPDQTASTESNTSISTTPLALKIRPQDTPHMRALKMRRYKILKGVVESQKNIKDSVSNLKTVKMQVKQIIPVKSSSRPDPSPFSDTIHHGITLQEGVEESQSNENELQDPQSLAERNLASFQENIAKALALPDNIQALSVAEQRKVYQSQVKTWSKALDDRLWTRQVNQVHLYNSNKNPTSKFYSNQIKNFKEVLK